MRLHEFTDPNDYDLLPDDAEDCIQQVERNRQADDAVPPPKHNPPTGKNLSDKR